MTRIKADERRSKICSFLPSVVAPPDTAVSTNHPKRRREEITAVLSPTQQEQVQAKVKEGDLNTAVVEIRKLFQ